MYKFTHEHRDWNRKESDPPDSRVELTLRGGETLDELFDAFAAFLRACTFSINGTIEVVPEYDPDKPSVDDIVEEQVESVPVIKKRRKKKN